MDKKIIFLLFVYYVITLNPNIARCDLPDPGTKSTTEFTGIISDYGPRNYISGTNPHQAIDYAISASTKGYAVEGGDIELDYLDTDYSAIKVGEWRYLHMATSPALSNQFQLYKKDSIEAGNPVDDVICFRSGSPLGTDKILGRELVDPYTFTDPITASSQTVQTSVSQTDWIFVPNYLNHLHLDYKNKTENPLKYVAYMSTNVPVLQMRIGKESEENTYELFSTSDVVYNKSILETCVDIRDDKDLNDVEFYIKPRDEDKIRLYQIKYTTYLVNCSESDILVLGNGDYDLSVSSIENSVSEKCYPVYIAENDCGLDYFKYRWYTSQMKNTEREDNIKALINDVSVSSGPVYPDGKYEIEIVATDIRGSSNTISTEIILDNFRPYVSKVTVKNDEQKRYEREWTFDGTYLNSTGPSTNEEVQPGTCTITINFNEPMSTATLTTDKFGIIQMVSTETVNNQRIFNGNIYINTNTDNFGLCSMTIFGKDLADNGILQISSGTSQIEPATELTRSSTTGLMQGTSGYDTLHSFTVSGYRPFVKRVVIESDSFESQWVWNGTDRYNYSSSGGPLTEGMHNITFEFSKPVQTPWCDIDTIGDITLTSSQPETQRSTWTGTFTINNTNGGTRTLYVKAKDLFDQELIGLTDEDILYLSQIVVGSTEPPAGTDVRTSFEVEISSSVGEVITSTTIAFPFYNLSLALDNQGNPAIGYITYEPYNSEGEYNARVIYKTPFGWADGYHPYYYDDYQTPFLNFEIDRYNRKYFLFNNTARHFEEGLRYEFSQGMSGTISPYGLVANLAYTHSLDLDSSGNPGIVYSDADSWYGYYGKVKYAKWNGTAWNTTILEDDIRPFYSHGSISIDKNDYAHSLYAIYKYEEGAPGGYRKYVKYNGAVLDEGNGIDENSVYIDTDIDGTPHIVYIKENDTGGYDLNYSNGGSTVTIESADDIESVSVKVDSKNNPHIVYFLWDNFYFYIRHAWKSGSEWNIEDMDYGDFNELSNCDIDWNDYLHIGITSEGGYTLKHFEKNLSPDVPPRYLAYSPGVPPDVVFESHISNIQISTVGTPSEGEISAMQSANLNQIGLIFNIIPNGTTFTSPARITMRYNDSSSEGAYRIYHYNGSDWALLPNQNVYTGSNIITADVYSLSDFCIMSDQDKPGNVNNFSASASSRAGTVELTWAAPGDDGTTGIISSGMYLIQYSTWENTQDVAWSTSTAQIMLSTSDVNPGELQTFAIAGFTGGTTYYFHIWTADKLNTWSEISNRATVCVALDVTAPAIQDSQQGDDTIRNTEWTKYNIDFYDEESGFNVIQYKVTTQESQGGDTVTDWANISMPAGATYYNLDWRVNFGDLWNLPATNYVSVRATDKAGNTAILNDVFYILKDDIPPESPILISPADSQYYQQTFDWSNSTDSESGIMDYSIEISTDSEFGIINYSSVTTVSQIGLAIAEGTYWWRARARDKANNCSDWSSAWEVLIDTTPPVSTGISSLEVLSSNVLVTTATAIDLLSGLHEQPYYIQMSTDKVSWGNYDSGWVVSSHTWTGLIPNTTYYFRAKARDNALNESGYSEISSTITLANPPANSFIVDRTSFSVQIQWDTNDNPAYTRWGILKSTDGFTNSTNTITDLSLNYTNTFYTDLAGINPAATYYYKVQAFNNAGVATSFDSVISTVTLSAPAPADTTAPDSINNLDVVSVDYTSAVLTWTAPGDDGTTGNISNGQYWIKYAYYNIFSDTAAWWNSAPYEIKLTTNTSPGNIESIAVSGLISGKDYWFAIKTADGSENWSGISNLLKITTLYTIESTTTVSNWGIQTIEPLGRRHTSIIDSAGITHVAYSYALDMSNDCLKYAKFDGILWSTQTIENIYYSTNPVSIALDSDNNPHIAYIIGYNSPSNPSALKYAKWAGTTWYIETIDTSDCNTPSIAIDANNNVYVAYIKYIALSTWELMCAKNTGSSWNIQTIETVTGTGVLKLPSLDVAMNTPDRPRISYQYWINISTSELKYAEWNGTIWSTGTVDSSGKIGFTSSLKLDSNDYTRIVYCDLTNANLKYAKWNGSSWDISIIDNVFEGDMYPAMAVDSNDNSHIIYVDNTYAGSPPYNSIIKYAKWTGTLWEKQTVTSVYLDYFNTSISLDSQNNPLLNYATNQGIQLAKLTNRPSLLWTDESGYTTDGINPEIGNTNTEFVYRIKYIDSDTDALMQGYPKVHIKKNGVEISSSPFSMSYVSGNYDTGAIYSCTRTLPTGGDYSYYFEGFDVWNSSAVEGSPINNKSGPSVLDEIAPSQVSIAVIARASSTVTLAWTASGDDGTVGDITDGKYWIEYDYNYPMASQNLIWSTNTVAGSYQTMTVTGLSSGTTWYFRLKSADEVLNWSAWSESVSTSTYNSIEISSGVEKITILYDNATLQGQTTSLYIEVVSTTFGKGEIAVSTAVEQGLNIFSKFYDIGPDGAQFSPQSILAFFYDDTLIPTEANENDLHVYKFYSDSGWMSLAQYEISRSTAENWIKIYITSASLFGVLAPDTVPPSAITSLFAETGTLSGSIDLTWISPGDDGTVGQIANGKWRIAYSTDVNCQFQISDYRLEITTTCSPLTAVYYSVTGLTNPTTYYFRIWTADEVPNWSGISNGATCYLASISTAAVEFICTIKQSSGTGVDFTSLSGWQSAIKCNLTASKVFSHGGITGSISDGSTVWGVVSGSTGTVTHVTSSQVLVKNISGAFQSGEQVYKDKDANYITISNAGSSAIATAKIDGVWSSPDINTLTFEGWTTSADNYIRIYTTPEARHNGHWDTTTKYRISVSEAYQGAINWMWWSGGAAHVRIDGLQIENTAAATGSNSPMGIRDNFDTPSSGMTCVHELSNCIFKWTGSGTPDNWYNCAVMLEPSTGTIKLWNNISIDFPNFAMNGWVTNGSTFCIYNNTVVYPAAPSASQFLGIHINGAANGCKLYLKNNIVQRAGTSGTCYELDTFNIQELENNISNDDTSPNDDYDNTTVSFVAGAAGYFLLASTDTAAVNQGVDLSTDAVLAFNTDIKGNVRPAGTAWDIGADEMIPDNTAPAAITTLTASTGTAEGSIELSWLSPGDDGTSGQIANGKWLIAYSTDVNYQFQISDYKLQITTTCLPLSPHRYTLAGLTGNATYYFRIWTLDESSNYSDVSNGATFYVGYSLNAGLAGHWKLDETSGSSAADSSGNGNNGTLYGNSAWTSLGRIDGGIYLDGSGDYINMGDPGSGVLDFGAGQDFSLSLWFRSVAGNGYENLLSKGDGCGASDGWSLRDGWNDSTIIFRNNDVEALESGEGYFDASWHHVVVSVDRDENTRLYIDGILQDTLASSNWNSSFANVYNFQAGRRSAYGDEYFKGYMDDVRVYSRALSAGEAEFLYSAAPAPVEFVSVIKQNAASDVDFTSLAAWQSCIKCNLTTSRVFSITNQSNPGIQSNRKVFGQTSNSTGTVVHVSSAGTQVLIKSITGKFQNGEKIFEDGAGGWARYLYLGDAGYLPIATAKIDGTWTSADTNRLDFSGWTTSADNYIRIYTSTEARHSGHWNTTAKYRISVSEAYQGAINWPWWSYTAHVRIDGLQIENTANATGSNNPMGISDRYNTPASGMLCIHDISNCIFKWTGGGTPDNWNNCAVYISPSTGTVKVWSNISIDFPNFVSAGGIGYAGGKENTFCIYNNTVVNPGKPGSHFLGIMLHSDGNPDITNVYLKNNIVQRTGTSGTCYDLQTFTDKEYEHNISNDATSPNNDYDNKTVSFKNGAAGYFLLASTDTSAKNQGVNLSTDTRLAFSTDINGDNRPFGSAWDIGADEFTDFVAPSAITNLSANTGDAAAEIDLTWTSPGDDGTTGSIYNGKFRIQYSSYPQVQWGIQNAQVVISTTCTPLSIQMYTVTGFTVETTYYFRIWTADGSDNYSELSNGATAWADCAGGMGMFVVIGTGPDPTFKLGEVFSYPNPAKGGITPTIHIECGIADKVELKIYNIAGERVYQADITDYLYIVQSRKQFRQVYAYEYAWNIREIASGVYIYLIYAEKSGEQPIKVMKKLAIIK